MRRTLLLIVALALVAACCMGRQKGTDVRHLDTFTSVNVVGSMKVLYSQASGSEVRVVGDCDRLDIKVRDGALYIKFKSRKIGNVYLDDSYDDNCKVTVYVKSPEVRHFNLVGSGSISADRVKTDRLTCNLAGSGSMSFKRAEVGDINLCLAGSGDINAAVSGTSSLRCSLAGTGCITVSGDADRYARSVAGTGVIKDAALTYKSCERSAVGCDMKQWNGTSFGQWDNAGYNDYNDSDSDGGTGIVTRP